jgi:hypothetical protein
MLWPTDDRMRPAYLNSPTAWRFTQGTRADPVAWSTLSQEELKKMKVFTTPKQFLESGLTSCLMSLCARFTGPLLVTRPKHPSVSLHCKGRVADGCLVLVAY